MEDSNRNFKLQTCEDFIEVLASKAAVPGGGGAAGKAGVIDGNYLREGQIVIDVGINVNKEGKLCGDVNFEEAEKIVDAITPVPRGVGGVTTSILLEHVVDAAIAQNR